MIWPSNSLDSVIYLFQIISKKTYELRLFSFQQSWSLQEQSFRRALPQPWHLYLRTVWSKSTSGKWTSTSHVSMGTVHPYSGRVWLVDGRLSRDHFALTGWTRIWGISISMFLRSWKAFSRLQVGENDIEFVNKMKLCFSDDSFQWYKKFNLLIGECLTENGRMNDLLIVRWVIFLLPNSTNQNQNRQYILFRYN